MEIQGIIIPMLTCIAMYVFGYRNGYKDGGKYCEIFYHSVLRGNMSFTLPGKKTPVKIQQED